MNNQGPPPMVLSPDQIAAYYAAQQQAPAGPPAPTPADASYWGGVSQAPPPAGPAMSQGPAPGVEALPPAMQGQLFGALGAPPPAPPPPPAPVTEFDPTAGTKITGFFTPNGEGLGKPPPAPAAAPSPSPASPAGPAGPPPPPAGAAPAPKGQAGGGSGPGDFGVGAARKELYGTFPREQGAIQQLADAEKAQADAKAAGMSVIGADQMRAAEQAARENEEQQRIFRDYQDETNRQLDMVRSRQVDPARLFPDNGTKAMALIGGVLGGIYQGLNKMQDNPFLRDLNQMIDRDIAIQERSIDRDFKAVSDRRNLLGEMRQTFKDKQLAEAQTRAIYYEGFKQQLAAEVAQYDNPAIQARANAAMNGVDRQLGALKLQDRIQEASRAAAAAAFQRAEAQRKFKNYLEFEDMVTRRMGAEGALEKGKGKNELRERFVPVELDPHTGEPVGYMARSGTEAGQATKQIMAMKRLEALAQDALAIRAQEGMLGRLANREAPAGVYTPEWQVRIRSKENQLIGAIKEADALGALDNGVERFAKPITGNLDSVGSAADERLRELIASTQEKLDIQHQAIAGQRARMLPGENIVFEGGAYAGPRNQVGSTGVRREAP